jgi:uncharacterized repeat protein (TIGR03803 family)
MILVLAVFAVAAILPHDARAASSTQVIYSFAGDEDGEYTDTDLVVDAAGNLYGSSVLGGDFGGGTVFQLSPSGSGWTHTVLYSFTGGLDGGEPYKGVTLDAEGNLIGTAVTGGNGPCEGGCGVIYKLTNNGGVWTQTVIHNFTGQDGAGPGAGVTFDKHGSFYGMVPIGGTSGLGAIYQMQPQQDGTYKFRIIHSFTGGNDGSSGSAGRMILDAAGNLYGVATTGGTNGKGTVFKLSHTQNGNWSFKTLYTFKGQPDAGFPYGGLLADGKGNLYGTTYWDGANNLGSVYQLAHQAGGTWKERVLYSFKGGSDGNGSISNLVADKAGNLYGTTSEGGAGCSCGLIFKLTPGTGGKWTESVAYRFNGAPDAGFAYNGMVKDANGNFFGATVHGGTGDEGSIYQFIP